MISETLPHLRSLQLAAVEECRKVRAPWILLERADCAAELHHQTLQVAAVIADAVAISAECGAGRTVEHGTRFAIAALSRLINECDRELAKEHEHV